MAQNIFNIIIAVAVLCNSITLLLLVLKKGKKDA